MGDVANRRTAVEKCPALDLPSLLPPPPGAALAIFLPDGQASSEPLLAATVPVQHQLFATTAAATTTASIHAALAYPTVHIPTTTTTYMQLLITLPYTTTQFPTFPQDQHSIHPPAPLPLTQLDPSRALGVPFYDKLEFPTYDSKKDPLAWINRCEYFFCSQQTAETDMVWLASYHLTGIVQHWYYQLEHDACVPSWSHLKELCHLRFGPLIRSNPLGALAQLPFINPVQEYIDQFLVLLCGTEALTPTH